MSRMLSIVADIGGTNTRVAIAEGDRIDRTGIRRFANAEHSGIDAVLTFYLAEMGILRCDGACVAAAGPVHSGVATMTNLKWTIDQASVGRATGATRVAVVNDLQAQGYALGHLAAGSLRTIIASPTTEPVGAVRLAVGVGTGFNAATVYETAAGRLVTASEYGQVSLPIRSEADLQLAEHVCAVPGFACVEDVLSGRGLERLYGWLDRRTTATAAKPAVDIMAAIAQGDDPVASRTREVFLRIFGAVTGDLALTHLPFGGIYLIGGVARAFAPYLQDHGFTDAFRDKGRFAEFMRKFPVHVIEDDFAALAGCAIYLNGLISGSGSGSE